MTALLPAFIIGLAGSLHCVGMCSPLVVAASRAGGVALFRNLVYNGGRIVTYGIMGALVGTMGSGLELLGAQQWLSVLAGIALLLVAVFHLPVQLPAFLRSAIGRLTLFLKSMFTGVVRRPGPAALFGLGMINGLLPCGLTLAALTWCVSLPGPVDGFLAMVLFGLGTLPAMTGLAVVMKSMIARFRVKYQTVQTVLLIVSATLLIARGSIHLHDHHGATPDADIVVCGPEGK